MSRAVAAARCRQPSRHLALAVLVFENVWGAPFGASVRRSSGQLVASGRIPIQALAAAVEADELAIKEGV